MDKMMKEMADMAKEIADASKTASAMAERSRRKSHDHISKEESLNWTLTYCCRDLTSLFRMLLMAAVLGMISTRLPARPHLSLARSFCSICSHFPHPPAPLGSCTHIYATFDL